MNWDALKQEVVALLVQAGEDALDEVEADFRNYARNLATWSIQAIQSKNKTLLNSVKGQAKLLAARNQIQIQRKLLTTITDILGIVMKTAFALAMGAVK